MNTTRGLEFRDQPERQTMSFEGMPASVEIDPTDRWIKLVFLVDDNCGGCPVRAKDIVGTIEQEFTGIKLTGEWLRHVLHQSDGVRIGTLSFTEQGAAECTIFIEKTANFDKIYECIMHVLKSQVDYESRGPSLGFTSSEEDAIENMPKETEEEIPVNPVTHTASEAAQRVLFAMVRGRHRSA